MKSLIDLIMYSSCIFGFPGIFGSLILFFAFGPSFSTKFGSFAIRASLFLWPCPGCGSLEMEVDQSLNRKFFPFVLPLRLFLLVVFRPFV